ncbi:MAG: TatD family hydrolase [Spirochaetaceae bacterium]|nr:TatD family hydrolase [Spirochaetaceae bacterium]
MASDAHAHPCDLLERCPGAEAERRRLGVSCAASAWNLEEFEAQENLALEAARDGAAPLALCFAVHPQFPAACGGEGGPAPRWETAELLVTLETLAAEKRLSAVGETGFDLYSKAYRDTEDEQEELFRRHLNVALRRDLPVVLHIRRAMHKVFSYSKELKALPAVVFHSYSGTFAEGKSLLGRGINAYFSFGNAVLLNHKAAMESCARLPPERLLTETDAPYQPPRGRPFSSWADLPAIIAGAAALRREAGSPGGDSAELEAALDRNFRQVYGWAPA